MHRAQIWSEMTFWKSIKGRTFRSLGISVRVWIRYPYFTDIRRIFWIYIRSIRISIYPDNYPDIRILSVICRISDGFQNHLYNSGHIYSASQNYCIRSANKFPFQEFMLHGVFKRNSGNPIFCGTGIAKKGIDRLNRIIVLAGIINLARITNGYPQISG